MNASLYAIVRAIRGPIVLIVLGTLFWLDQSDQVGFGRTWPVLIILIGVMKLIERMVAPPLPPMPPQPPPVMPVPPPTMGGVR
jgi:hypothetical protein